MWTKNYDHMIYGSRDMVHDRWADRRRDGKSDIVGWPPKKYPKGWGASLMTACEGGVEPPTKFLKREGAGQDLNFYRGCWERGGDFFQRKVAVFHKI